MFRCHLSGLDLDPEEAWVLDIRAARLALREMKRRTEGLERVVNLLAQDDLAPIPIRGDDQVHVRRERRVVSRVIADALNAVCPDHHMFLTWRDWFGRARAQPLLALRRDPQYRERVAPLSASETEYVTALGRQVARRIAPGEHLPLDVWRALLGGVCVALRNRTADDVVVELRSRLRSGDTFSDLGVPEAMDGRLRSVLGRGASGTLAPPAQALPPGTLDLSPPLVEEQRT